MLLDGIQTLFDYNTWANGRVFEKATILSPSQFTAGINGQGASVQELLFHIVSAQQTWLARCQEREPPPDVNILQFSDCVQLWHYWETVDRGGHAFLQTLGPSHLKHIIHYVNPQGEANAYPLWHLLYHQLNHAAQHRSEVAASLTQLGHSPGWLDFLYYVDLRDGTTLHFS